MCSVYSKRFEPECTAYSPVSYLHHPVYPVFSTPNSIPPSPSTCHLDKYIDEKRPTHAQPFSREDYEWCSTCHVNAGKAIQTRSRVCSAPRPKPGGCAAVAGLSPIDLRAPPYAHCSPVTSVLLHIASLVVVSLRSHGHGTSQTRNVSKLIRIRLSLAS